MFIKTKSVLTKDKPFVVADITNFFENINTKLIEIFKSLIHDNVEDDLKEETSYRVVKVE
jgi:hypothetical protein